MAAPSHPIHRIALTPGEPSGIGPDLCIMQAQHNQPCEIIVIADPAMLTARAEQLGLTINIIEFNASLPAKQQTAGTLTILPVQLVAASQCGTLNRQNAGYVLQSITVATKGCIRGIFSAMVTGPVHKGIINDTGIAFSGHTEFIAGITGGDPVMMLTTPGLRVALVTTHLPLVDVSQAITPDRLKTIIRLLHHELQNKFSIAKPVILVCGLNPHAGESGHLGREEIDIITPVLNEFRNQGMELAGPLPADTLFTPRYLETADAVLAMYHDQGLPVLKHKGFGKAVNITLGLPIIRTSVDHGTALDLAGTGLADCGSMQLAINTALAMAGNTTQTKEIR